MAKLTKKKIKYFGKRSLPELTKQKLGYFIKDEKHAVKEYRHYGLGNLAKDEAKHRRFLEKKLKRMRRVS